MQSLKISYRIESSCAHADENKINTEKISYRIESLGCEAPRRVIEQTAEDLL